MLVHNKTLADAVFSSWHLYKMFIFLCLNVKRSKILDIPRFQCDAIFIANSQCLILGDILQNSHSCHATCCTYWNGKTILYWNCKNISYIIPRVSHLTEYFERLFTFDFLLGESF